MEELIHVKAMDIEPEHRMDHESYEYLRRNLIPKGYSKRCSVAMYEIPPRKSSFPYHYHILNEESFYILSGKGILKSPQGNREVSAGDFLFFPANENGAHKLTNSSETEALIYLDFDATNPLEVAIYPDSGKVGIFGPSIRQLYKDDTQVDYYLDEK
jgi:uncharacterized cupin superfamily protein